MCWGLAAVGKLDWTWSCRGDKDQKAHAQTLLLSWTSLLKGNGGRLSRIHHCLCYLRLESLQREVGPTFLFATMDAKASALSGLCCHEGFVSAKAVPLQHSIHGRAEALIFLQTPHAARKGAPFDIVLLGLYLSFSEMRDLELCWSQKGWALSTPPMSS